MMYFFSRSLLLSIYKKLLKVSDHFVEKIKYELTTLTSNTNVTSDPINFVFEQEIDSSVQMNSEKRCSAYKKSLIGPSRVRLQWNSEI